jgi:hypothetical protein
MKNQTVSVSIFLRALMVIGLFMTLLTRMVTAQTYTYTGTRFSGFGGFNIEDTCPLQAQFTVPHPIPPNVGIAGGDLYYVYLLSSFSITDCLSTITNSNGYNSALYVATDSQGQIYEWGFGATSSQDVTINVGNGFDTFSFTALSETLSSNYAGIINGFFVDQDVYSSNVQGFLQGFLNVTYLPGTWTGGTGASPLSITTSSLPNSAVNLVYPTPACSPQSTCTTLMATGGTPPYTWSASGLPAGLAVSPTKGTISGTPTAGGNLTVTVQVTDSVGATASQAINLTIATCTTVLNGAVAEPSVSVTEISTSFEPNFGYTLAQAAQICNYSEFDWRQTWESLPIPSALFEASTPDGGAPLSGARPLYAPPAFNDPPVPNGYPVNSATYPSVYSYPTPRSLPVLYNPLTGADDPTSLFNAQCKSVSVSEPDCGYAADSSFILAFYDTPADPCLSGGKLAGTAICNGQVAPGVLAFQTHLIGLVVGSDTPVDTGIGFSWTDDFNGWVCAFGESTCPLVTQCIGCVSASLNSQPPEPGSGIGGVTVRGFNNIATFPPVVTAQILSLGNACNGIYGGTFVGNVTISADQNCTFINGTIDGNVQANGGNLVLSGVLVRGNVQFNGGGTFSVVSFTSIVGNLQIQNLPSGTITNQICNATVLGDLQFQNNGTAVQIGSAPPSSVPSSLPCGGNTIGGDLQIQNNAALTQIYNNAVGGNLQDQNNTAATQVFNNSVENQLHCQNDILITGGGNTAKEKQGQCSSF